MPEQNPQPGAPGPAPDTQMSQPQAAAMTGPDDQGTFPNPLHKPGVAPGSAPQGDWEERYRGLSRKYNEDKQAWDAERQQLSTSVDTLGGKFSELEQKLMGNPQQAPAAQPAPSTQPAPQAEPAKTDSGAQSDFLDAMAERDAVLYRDKLLFEYMAQNPNIGLAQFRENIPVVAPTLNDDGSVNDAGQRGAIEALIKNITGVRQDGQQATQQAMTKGWTPGVSPGAPAEDSWETQVDKYYKAKEAYSDPALDNMAPGEQARVQQEYYALHEKVGKHLPSQTAPWMSAGDLADSIRQLQGKVGHLEDFMMPNQSPGT